MGPLWHYQSGRAKTDASDQRSIVAARCEEDDDDDEGSPLQMCVCACVLECEGEEEVTQDITDRCKRKTEDTELQRSSPKGKQPTQSFFCSAKTALRVQSFSSKTAHMLCLSCSGYLVYGMGFPGCGGWPRMLEMGGGVGINRLDTSANIYTVGVSTTGT